jgi:hypothetical protein
VSFIELRPNLLRQAIKKLAGALAVRQGFFAKGGGANRELADVLHVVAIYSTLRVIEGLKELAGADKSVVVGGYVVSNYAFLKGSLVVR